MTLRGMIRGLQRRLQPPPDTPGRPLSVSFPNGHWDALRVEPSGLVALEGWWTGADLHDLPLPRAELDGRDLPLLHLHRTFRPDVAQVTGQPDLFLGVVVTWLDRTFPRGTGPRRCLRVTQAGTVVSEHTFPLVISEPHYSALLHTDRILGREQIYGVGPPARENPEAVAALARRLRGKILDFGCGSGFLVKILRAAGAEAFGLEVRREAIERHLHPEARPYVTLYDGRLPTPYEDNAFDGVISAEVLEHIPDPAAAIRELARLCRGACLLTVPDMSAIPLCFYHHVVPWHLLEATHVNFFTQSSLEKALAPHFNRLTFFRLHPDATNGTTWYGSLAVLAEKR
jgi:SAM-dependent methyltransferase